MIVRWMVVLMLSLSVCCSIGMAQAAQFQEILPGTIPASVGMAWGDYDSDGYPDLFLAGYNHPDNPTHGPRLYHNNHNLNFTDVSAAVGLPSEAIDNEGAAFADFNNDGRLDILASCDSGSPFLYQQELSQFILLATPSGLIDAGPTLGPAWCDYDGDNLLDVFLSTHGGSYLYHNNSDGTFTDLHIEAGVVISGRVETGAWGDLDNDGWPDLLITRSSASAMLFRNNGDGTFTDISTASGVTGAINMYSVGWADYNNDGWLDFYMGTDGDQDITQDLLFLNNQNGTFTDVTTSAGLSGDTDTVGATLAWADYDNDGFLDLYVGTWNWTGAAPSFLWHNNRNGTFTNTVIGSGLEDNYAHTAAAWADLDLDGRLDLMQANGNHEARLFHNIGSAGNWLRVRVLTSGTGDATGSESVREAIGGRVDLNLDNDDSFPAGNTLNRLIDGGSGHWGQNEQVAHFGVGSTGTVAVRVMFPDGSVVIHRSVPVNQQITIRDVPADREEIFDDVPLDYWAYSQTKGCVDAGIVFGYPDGTYQPSNPVTRDQMAIYIARALADGDANVPEFTDTPTFPDVPADYWALKYVEYAVDQGVVGGYEDGTYRPTNQVDRGTMAVYIARALVAPLGEAGLADYVPADPRNFPDVPTDYWSYKHIEYCVENGVVNGYADGTYQPAAVVTRDQMAVYVARAFDLVP